MVGQSVRKVDGGRIAGAAIVLNVVHVKWIFTLANLKSATVSCYGQHQGSFIPSSAMANTIFGTLSGHWTADLGAFMNQGITFQALTIRDMSVATNLEYRSSLAPVPAGGANPAMPQDVALVLTAQCNERGRGAKGRMYFPGWTTLADAGNGQATTGARDALTALGGHILGDLNTVALSACVPKPERQEYIGLTGAHHDARPSHQAQVTAYVCQNTEWDTQRRRGF